MAAQHEVADVQAVQSSTAQAPNQVHIRNALVAILGVSDYHQHQYLKPLDGVIKDVQSSIALWNTYFNYDTHVLADHRVREEVKADNNARKKIYQRDIQRFLEPIRRSIYDKPYDALIFMLFGHGRNESLVTSDFENYEYDEFRQFFNGSNLVPKHGDDMLRLFIVDTCRGNDIPDIRPKRGVASKQYNVESNINTLYATTKGYTVGDVGTFVRSINEVLRNIDLTTHSLSDAVSQITKHVDESSAAWYCPEYVSRSKSVIYLERKDAASRNDVQYLSLEGPELDEQKVQDIPLSTYEQYAQYAQYAADSEPGVTDWNVWESMKALFVGLKNLAVKYWWIFVFLVFFELNRRKKVIQIRREPIENFMQWMIDRIVT
mmetsp:Transcript_31328/g.50785  ORF Transcript_31328/g.50785 Transcript_31328/m.50785 type:complete len:376 (+) Transcript_31328:23-1150(+)